MNHNLNISSIPELANILETSEDHLWYLYRNVERDTKLRLRKKKNGDLRKTFETSKPLKEILQKLNKLLQKIYLPSTLQGAVPGRSPLSNGFLHVGNEVVICLDIKDFYPSVHYTRVHKLFVSLNCSPEVSKLLTRITTFEGTLAQGFPTSSTIANLLLKGIEPRLSNLCAKHGLNFSFFQDDLTISGSLRARKLLNLFVKIIEQCGYKLNIEKTRVATNKQKQTVTGVTVNEKINIPKDYYRNLRAAINNCSINGIETESQKAGMNANEFIRSIYGKINWVSALNPVRGEKLLVKFESLEPNKTNSLL